MVTTVVADYGLSILTNPDISKLSSETEDMTLPDDIPGIELVAIGLL